MRISSSLDIEKYPFPINENRAPWRRSLILGPRYRKCKINLKHLVISEYKEVL